MKKVYTLISIAAFALSASAWQVAPEVRTVSEPTNAPITLKAAPAKVKKLAAPKKAESIDELLGSYIVTHFPLTDSNPVFCSNATVAAGDTEGTIKITGLITDGATDVITATVDLEAGTFTIPVQTAYTSSSYGACSISQFSEDGGMANEAVTGYILEDGTLQVSQYGVFITTGAYAGYYFGDISCQNALVEVPNGVMEFANANATIAGHSPATVVVYESDELDEDNKYWVCVSNFAGLGDYVEFSLDEDQKVLVPVQEVENGGSTYGVFSTTGDTGGDFIDIEGTATEEEVTLNDGWTIASTTGYWYNVFSATKIRYTNGNEFFFPAATAVEDNVASKAVATERYYNLAGQQADKAFDGLNIVVRTYTDGTTQAVKVIR
ncbi:MAG: hypothetical protein IJ632_06875 [Muribaculaceae bacterium]|nr:hypothetical protein [Muribaculaceae bacterium]